jgi:hypothetical protein
MENIMKKLLIVVKICLILVRQNAFVKNTLTYLLRRRPTAIGARYTQENDKVRKRSDTGLCNCLLNIMEGEYPFLRDSLPREAADWTTFYTVSMIFGSFLGAF